MLAILLNFWLLIQIILTHPFWTKIVQLSRCRFKDLIIFTNFKMIQNCNFKMYNLFILLVWKRQQSRIQKNVGSGFGWSAIEFFRLSKTGTMLLIKFISLVQLRKIGRIWPRMCGKVFTSKSLQIPSIYFKEQSPKKKIRY